MLDGVAWYGRMRFNQIARVSMGLRVSIEREALTLRGSGVPQAGKERLTRGLNLRVHRDGTPLEPITSHWSLQNAYFTPSPFNTAAKNPAAQTPVVTCVHVLTHAPDGFQELTSAAVVRGTYALQVASVTPETKLPVTPSTVPGPPPEAVQVL
jgi:hypothetical protein